MSRFQHLELGRSSMPLPSAEAELHNEAYYHAQAQTKMDEGEFEAALAAYSRALRFDPNLEEAWVGQTRALIELGELEESILWANKGLERLPDSAGLLAAKGLALARRGELEKGLGFSDAALQQRNPGAWVWLARADVMLSARRQGAMHCLQKAIELSPNDWRVLMMAGDMCLDHGDSARAVSYLERAVKLHEPCAYLWLLLGRAYRSASDRQRAIACLKHALVQRRRFPAAEKELGEVERGGVRGLVSRLFTR